MEVKAHSLALMQYPENIKMTGRNMLILIINEMIPAVAAEELADYIDVFCDHGFFTVEETERILDGRNEIWLESKASCK